MSVFINLSNHSSENWSEEQRLAAEKYGDIVDVPFPQIPAAADGCDIDEQVNEYLGILSKYETAAVMLQGEFVFTYRLVSALKERRITVLAACSERVSYEFADKDGNTQRTSKFVFVKFREY